jgi:hypothetical protein
MAASHVVAIRSSGGTVKETDDDERMAALPEHSS